jgi:hypothetical protein
MTDIRISICDLNPPFVAEARHHLMDLPNVFEVAHRSVLDRAVDAVESPANSFGFMDGGVDWAYLQFFGAELQTRVQMIIRLQKFQELLVGAAVVVPTYHDSIRFLIVAPTMRVPKIITDPADIMLATRAAIRARPRFPVRSYRHARHGPRLRPGTGRRRRARHEVGNCSRATGYAAPAVQLPRGPRAASSIEGMKVTPRVFRAPIRHPRRLPKNSKPR